MTDSFVIALNCEYLGSFISPNNSLNTLLSLPMSWQFGLSPANLPLVTVLESFNTGVAPAVSALLFKRG